MSIYSMRLKRAPEEGCKQADEMRMADREGLKHDTVCIYAGIALFSRTAFLQGMKPPIFLVYRQAISIMIIAPLAIYNRRRNLLSLCLGLKTSGMIFAAAFFGTAANMNLYFEGLYLSSAAIATAMVNLVPVVTLVMATAMGQEKVGFLSMRSMAKILGTLVSVCGAVSMALLKGPKLLNDRDYVDENVFVGTASTELGTRLSVGFRKQLLLIPTSTNCTDHLYTTAWTCFFRMLQSTIFALFSEREWEAWRINTALELGVGAALTFFRQTWCISQRGPVLSAMFSPLNTVLATNFASIFLHEEINIGRQSTYKCNTDNKLKFWPWVRI
ncbi:WAT1-related protein At4g30420-like isoform X2 [Punica granatum]|uniref:WAT1-related protein n=1 Tax=Punica granatum TaxID=22663 RepID=A0A6P8D5G3_PUNGR|nr:WAT1-related protein At4g30420-like isoform X2 [Punica granatum]